MEERFDYCITFFTKSILQNKQQMNKYGINESDFVDFINPKSLCGIWAELNSGEKELLSGNSNSVLYMYKP